jgi:hypothetical protein
MAGDADLAGQVSVLMNAHHETVATLVRSPQSTVAPPRDARIGRRALEVLKSLKHDEHGLVEESVLGQGGMGW